MVFDLMKTNDKKAARLSYPEIKIGDVYLFKRKLAAKDVSAFATLTGDYNPLHTDPAFGRKSRFGKNVVHGMLAGSLFSTLLGMRCPGENCIYASQTINFRKPIFPGDPLTVKGTVISKTDSVKLVVMKTEIIVRGVVAVTGEARVLAAEEV